MGQLERSIEDYSQALRLNPKFALALYGRGITYSNNGQYDLAIDDYESALRLRPGWPGPLYGRGVARLKNGDLVDGNADMSAAAKTEAGVAAEFARLGGRL
jgi:tetratricopeptide (TPR) repeat protein